MDNLKSKDTDPCLDLGQSSQDTTQGHNPDRKEALSTPVTLDNQNQQSRPNSLPAKQNSTGSMGHKALEIAGEEFNTLQGLHLIPHVIDDTTSLYNAQRDRTN